MLRRLAPRLVALALLSSVAQASPAHEPPPPEGPGPVVSPASPASKSDGGLYYLVFDGPSAAEVIPRGSSPHDALAVAAVRARLGELTADHAQARAGAEALGAKVVWEFRRTANALQVLAPPGSLEALGRLPGVVRVERVPIVKRSLTTAVPFVGGYAAWSITPGIHGEGVRVGVIDTGIDYTHADFGGPGTAAAYHANDPAVIEPGSFPTAKVVGGHDFVGDAYDASGDSTSPEPDDDPLDCAGEQSMNISGGHGTHVAGIVGGQGVTDEGATFAGPYDQSVDPQSFRVGPGVAPAASLYALKIFGCTGSTGFTSAALDWASDPNDDGDLSDRLDVINMSLGGSYGVETGTDLNIIKSLSKLGTVLVVAAGNDGNAFYVTGSPSTATEVLSVAATTDSFTFGALTVTAPAAIAGDVIASEGAFSVPLKKSGPKSGPLVASQPKNGCSPFTNAADLKGKIALIERGSCTFASKVKNAEVAGAIAAVVTDNQTADYPFVMAGDGTDVGVPAMMITKAAGDMIRPQLAQGVAVVMDGSKVLQSTVGADQVADFSSRGPRALDNLLKPEIGAPGLAIDSAGVGTGAGPRQLSGTSMACPMVAGGAALVRQAHPDLPSADVKALLMNNAVPAKGPSGEAVPVTLVGAGRMQVDRAVAGQITARVSEPEGAVGLSFGAIVSREKVTAERSFVVRNHGAKKATLSAEATPSYELSGVTAEVSPKVIEVPAGGEATATLTLTVEPEKLPPEKPDPLTPDQEFGQDRHFLTEAAGHITLTPQGEGSPLGLPYHSIVRAASELEAKAPSRCGGESGPLTVTLSGPSAHPSPVVTVFELGATSKEKGNTTPLGKMTDLVAVGVGNNLKTAESFEKASVYFAVATAGPWTTPALGQVSLVRVSIDTNGDKKADYEVRAEPLTSTGPFGDVLTSNTYNLKTGQVVSHRFINLFPRSTVDTQPFDNSVIVLPVTLGDIKLAQGKAAINYWVSTTPFAPGQSGDTTQILSYDPEAAVIDTASAGLMGRPVFVGGEPIKIGVNDPQAALPDLLLVYHTNVPGKRFQVVSLSDAGQGSAVSLTAKAEPPAQAPPGKNVAVAVGVRNTGSAPADGVVLSGTVDGAKIVSATSPQGPCSLSPLSCQLGSLSPGAEAKVTLTLLPDGQGDVTVKTSTSSAGCETDASDNDTTTVIKVGTGGSAGGAGAAGASGAAGAAGARVEADAEASPLSVGGGCDCSTSAPSPRGSWAWAALGALFAARGLRRRRGGSSS